MNTKEFIDKLDAFFEHDDMDGAGEYLRFSRRTALSEQNNSLLLTVLNEMMGYYRKTKEETPGMESVDSGLSLCRKMGLENTEAGATTLLNAATTMKAFGRAEEAMPYYEKAEEIYRSLLSPADSRIAGLCNNMALTLVDLGRYAEAENRYLHALSILRQYTDKNTDIANTYVNMTHLYEKLEDYEKIEASLDAAKQALEEDPVRNGYYAYTCRKCAPSFGYFGYFAYEKELNERADLIYARH